MIAGIMILIGGILSLFSNGKWLMIFTSLAYMLNQLHQYQKINIFFKDEGDFLMNYGKAFFQWLAQHEKAIETLERAKLHLHTTIIQMGLGDSYKAIKKYGNAEENYWQAWYMAPGGFYPKYLLAKLYDETEHKQKA